jgi:hypothetical protein
MTMKVFQSAAATLRRAESFARVVVRARRAGREATHGHSNASNEPTSGRYFGLLVHLDRSDR